MDAIIRKPDELPELFETRKSHTHVMSMCRGTNLVDVNIDPLHQSCLPAARHSEHDARDRVLPRRPQLIPVKISLI
jgi:hypothetical protein